MRGTKEPVYVYIFPRKGSSVTLFTCKKRQRFPRIFILKRYIWSIKIIFHISAKILKIRAIYLSTLKNWFGRDFCFPILLHSSFANNSFGKCKSSFARITSSRKYFRRELLKSIECSKHRCTRRSSLNLARNENLFDLLLPKIARCDQISSKRMR